MTFPIDDLTRLNLATNLIDLLNRYVKITEVDADSECLLYLCAEFRNKGKEAMSEFLMEMMGYVQALLPDNYDCYAYENGDGFVTKKRD